MIFVPKRIRGIIDDSNRMDNSAMAGSCIVFFFNNLYIIHLAIKKNSTMADKGRNL
jgi:hypothetical protein